MRQNARNSGNIANRLFNQLAVQKKKTVLALCLITLMAFMWIRVLTSKAPQAAKAGLLAGQMDVETQSEPELKISFIELPQAAGRNDVITRDFFDSDGWQDFVDREERKLTGEEVDIISKQGDQEVIRRVAEKLRLEAIVSSENPAADPAQVWVRRIQHCHHPVGPATAPYRHRRRLALHPPRGRRVKCLA